jgi:hypothetical protein
MEANMEKRMDTPKEKSSRGMFGLLAKFNEQEDLITAVSRTYSQGYRKFDAHSPYPVEELARAMHLKPSPLPYLILAGGLFGGVGGFLMMITR